MDQLKLIAFDNDDIEVVSAHLQDAIVKVSDILWRPEENRLVVVLNRFDWEAAIGAEPHYYRRRAALRFERALALKCRNLSPKNKDAVLNLLAVEFEQTNAPGGVVTLVFSGGAALRVEVECLEVEIADLGPSWKAMACPKHPDGVASGRG